MLTKKDAQTIRLLKQHIEKLTPVRRVIVYGSRVRGKTSPDSDIDVFIELTELTPELRRSIREAAWAIGLERGIVISTFVASTDQLRNSPLATDPIIRTIEREGVPV